MKIKNIMFFVMLLFFSTACNEYHISTKINDDGTCERIIRIETDSPNQNFEDIPFYIDDTWESRVEKSKKDSSHVVKTFRKKFSSVEDLNMEIAKGSGLKSKIGVEKKFRWFYTYYSYTETYKKRNPFKQIDISKDLSKADLDSLQNGRGGSELTQKVDNLLGRSITEELIDSIAAVFKKHSLYDKSKMDFLRKRIFTQKEENKSVLDNPDNLIKELESDFEIKASPSLKTDIEKIYKGLEKKFEEYANPSVSEFTSDVILPGLIVKSNASSIEGNDLTWKASSKYFTFTDFVMCAESRVANTWAIIVTGIIALVLLIVIIIPIFRKRNY